MVRWFRNHAPIRIKFRVIVLFQVLVAASTLVLMHIGASLPSSGRWNILLAGFITTSLPVLLTWYSGKLISDPYVATVLRMEGLASGELESPILFTDHRDCVGRMARAMQIFRTNAERIKDATAESAKVVDELGSALTRLAVGDLTCHLHDPFANHYEAVRNDFNGALTAIGSTMSAVTDVAGGINHGAGDIRAASDNLSRRTEQQAAALEETAAAMDEITSTVRQTAQGAQRANELVAQAQDEARQSDEVVKRAVTAMEEIDRASGEISEIITVIDGIAFQTNLLALNAGVEAARAGDAGKGFAVVASEVRALAQRSADAAKDVKTRITASVEQIDAGVKLVSATGTSLQGIIGRVGEISTIVSEIASSAERQAVGLQEVNTAIAEMDGVTQQNAAMVEEATAATRELAAEAEDLTRKISRFKLSMDLPGATSTPASPPDLDIRERTRPNVRKTQVHMAPALKTVAQEDWSGF